MSLPVSLREFVDEMDMLGDEWRVFLNRRTGEFLSAGPDEQAIVEAEEEDGEEEQQLPAWQKEILPKLREAMSSEDWIMLPDKFELDEYRIMANFNHTISDATLSADLLDTIGGRGTFGRFKNMVHRHNLWNSWNDFRDNALRKFAKEWLEAHEIAYRD